LTYVGKAGNGWHCVEQPDKSHFDALAVLAINAAAEIFGAAVQHKLPVTLACFARFHLRSAVQRLRRD
jgi:hypothetical protein